MSSSTTRTGTSVLPAPPETSDPLPLPEPESDPFIKIGDKVNKGQTLLIVEAMKTMNDIVADKDGVIKEILVGNEQPVQYDDPLIILE